MAQSVDGRPPGFGERPFSKKPEVPAAAREKELWRVEALQRLMERMAGASIEELARTYAVDLPPAGEPLTDEIKEELREQFERLAFERLAPLVLAVYEANLKMGNLDAARDIGLSLGVIKRPPTAPPKVTIVQPEVRAINSIEDYRLERQQRAYKALPRRIDPPKSIS